MMEASEFNHLSTYFLAEEAEKRGIKVEKIFPETKLSYLKASLGNNVQTIIGQRISQMSFNAHLICKKKEMTRRFLNDNGVKTTEGEMFNKNEVEDSLKYADKVGFPVVIKPVDGTWGSFVFVGIKTKEEARSAIKKVTERKSEYLIEKQFIGNEYRVLATKDKLLGIINRVPANVTGNGKNTIEELISIKNSDPRRGDGHNKPLVKIKIDEEVIAKLKAKELDLGSVLQKGEVVYLKNVSNISQGGDSIDVTDVAHPKVKELAPKVIAAIPGLPYGGFDFLTPDIAKDPEEVGYAVIEINDSPMLSMHHIPFEGKQRNVSKEIINMAFPETA